MLPADLAALDPDPHRRDARRSLALAKTMYIFIHPEDEQTRGEALATMSSEALGRYQADPDDLVAGGLSLLGLSLSDIKIKLGDEATGRQWIDDVARMSLSLTARELFMPAGGFGSVARARGTNHVLTAAENNLRQAIFAGVALSTLYQIAHHKSLAVRNGASMNNVWWMLEKHSPIAGPRDSRDMKKLWGRWKNVAHLGAAYYIIWEKRGSRDEDTGFISKELSLFLRLAKRFEDFGTSFHPHPQNTSDPILGPDTIWRVPVNAGAADEEMPADLSMAAQLRLASYKAPTLLG